MLFEKVGKACYEIIAKAVSSPLSKEAGKMAAIGGVAGVIGTSLKLVGEKTVDSLIDD